MVEVPGAIGEWDFFIMEKSKISRFANWKIFKNVKQAMKNLYFLKILKEILRFFEKFFKILSKFSPKFMGNLENFGNMHL